MAGGVRREARSSTRVDGAPPEQPWSAEPCNVIVYEDGDESVVAILDPVSMLEMVENPDLEPVAREARSRLRRVANALED